MAGLKDRPVQGGSRQVVVLSALDVEPSWTTDGELWVTQTERENDVTVVYQEVFSSVSYVVLVDLDNFSFPHRIQNQSLGRIDITNVMMMLDVATNTSANVLVGTILRIDGVDADIHYFVDFPFNIGAVAEDQRLHVKFTPSQVKTDIVGGVFQHLLTNLIETNVAAVNTGVTLNSPAGANTVTPAVGDLVLKYDHSAGSANSITTVLYHTQ
jgi:hypothetical protein